MKQQMPIFPVYDAYTQLKEYITDDWLSVRVIHQLDEVFIIIHIEPSDAMPDDVDMEYYLWEQTDTYADEFVEWFPHLNVRWGERDKDWYIMTISR